MLLFTLLPLQLSAADAAGQVIWADAGVTAREGAGAERALERGDGVFPGDTVNTGEGRARLRFRDGGTITLITGTRFQVDEYQFDQAGTADRAVFSLLKGGLQAISGAIGKERPDDYRMNTLAAVIGLRGTEYRIRDCREDCFMFYNLAFPDGVYVNAVRDSLSVSNNAGSLVLEEGMSAYIRDMDTPPELTPRFPEQDFAFEPGPIEEQLPAPGQESPPRVPADLRRPTPSEILQSPKL